MGLRARVGMGLVVVSLLAACSGGGGDDADLGDAEPILSIDPCSLLGPDEASELAGVDVTVDGGAPTGTALAASIGCSYRPTDEADGSAIAASLVLGGTDEEEPEAAVEARVAELTEGDDDAEVADTELGDAGVVVTTTTVVHVVYVVEDVVVSIEVAPKDGVDDAAKEAVEDFADETLAPITAAIAAKGGDEQGIQAGELVGLWVGDWGTMAIEEVDGEIRGAYTHDDGRITGTFEDGVFTGRWTELPTREGPSDAGPVEFRFAKTDDDTISLDGRWSYDSDPEPLGHDDWDLTLSEDEVPEELVAAFEDEASFEAQEPTTTTTEDD